MISTGSIKSICSGLEIDELLMFGPPLFLKNFIHIRKRSDPRNPKFNKTYCIYIAILLIIGLVVYYNRANIFNTLIFRIKE